ncbi:MAG TPA: polysaccharide deacetylase [Tissierellia bacterium]|nr:polysaccharide deacetylase [Tissierellia bacterium]
MGRLKKCIANLFRRKYFITFIIILLVIFAETSYRFILKLDSYLVQAEEASHRRGIQIEEMEMYDNYVKNRKLFDRKVAAIKSSMLSEGGYDIEEAVEADEIECEEENTDKVQDSEDMEEEEISQEPAERETIEEEIPQEVSQEGNKRIAYITFDDGPSSIVTPQVLDILARYDIKATFFVVGKFAEKNSDVLKRIYEEGHAIGNHSYSHNYNYIYKSVSNFVQELDITNEVFKSILGEEFETDIIRFPGGSFGDWKLPYREQVIALGYRYIDWNSLNGDAEGHNISKEKLVERFMSTYHGQKELIILMHDTDAKYTTIEALPIIIEFLIDEGYEFATF